MRKWAFAAIAAGFALRAGLLAWYLSTHGGRPETWEPEVIASNLLSGKGYVWDYLGVGYRTSNVPLFPLLCWGLHRLGGPGFGAYFAFQGLLAAGIVWLAYRLTSVLFGEKAGLLAALLAAADPGMAVYQSYKVDVNALSTFLILGAAFAFVEAMRRGRARWAATGGLAAGLGILTRPDLVCLLALPLGWARKPRTAAKAAGLFWAAALLAVLPWLIRNHRLHGRWILQDSAELFWRGNNPNETGTTVTRDGTPQFLAAPPEFRERIRRAGEMEREDIFRREAVEFIRRNPGGFLRRALRNAAAFWWFTPTYGQSGYGWVPPPLKAAFRVYYALLAAAALAGLALAARRPMQGPPEGLGALLGVAGALTAIHSATYVEGRHRLLVLPFLLAAAAHGTISIWYNSRGHDPGAGAVARGALDGPP